MFHMPMSSPMITRMLGFFAVAPCACAVAPPPIRRQAKMATAPSTTFRTSALISMFLLLFDCLSAIRAGYVANAPLASRYGLLTKLLGCEQQNRWVVGTGYRCRRCSQISETDGWS